MQTRSNKRLDAFLQKFSKEVLFCCTSNLVRRIYTPGSVACDANPTLEEVAVCKITNLPILMFPVSIDASKRMRQRFSTVDRSSFWFVEKKIEIDFTFNYETFSHGFFCQKSERIFPNMMFSRDVLCHLVEFTELQSPTRSAKSSYKSNCDVVNLLDIFGTILSGCKISLRLMNNVFFST